MVPGGNPGVMLGIPEGGMVRGPVTDGEGLEGGRLTRVALHLGERFQDLRGSGGLNVGQAVQLRTGDRLVVDGGEDTVYAVEVRARLVGEGEQIVVSHYCFSYNSFSRWC